MILMLILQIIINGDESICVFMWLLTRLIAINILNETLRKVFF